MSTHAAVLLPSEHTEGTDTERSPKDQGDGQAPSPPNNNQRVGHRHNGIFPSNSEAVKQKRAKKPQVASQRRNSFFKTGALENLFGSRITGAMGSLNVQDLQLAHKSAQ